jgi:hypothetical protein
MGVTRVIGRRARVFSVELQHICANRPHQTLRRIQAAL